MQFDDSAVWARIRDWDLPDFPPPKVWFAQKETPQVFASRLEHDLSLTGTNARRLIAAYRQWLFVCALEGRRMQASGLVTEAERLHREAGENWAALVAALPEGALSGEPVPRGPENDAAYQATLDRLAEIWPEEEWDRRFWPATWRYEMERKLPRLFRASLVVMAVGAVPWLVPEVGPLWHGVGVALCVVGAIGLLAFFLAQENLTPFNGDDWTG